MVKLKVLSEKVGEPNPFTDFTDFAYDFTFNSFRLVLGAGDNLYIAHPHGKVMGQLYFELRNTDDSLNHPLDIQYWNGSAWEDVPRVSDETDGLTRAGFIYWDRIDMQEVTVNGLHLKWVRLHTDHMKAIGRVRGINFVFSNDRDLLEDNPDVLDYIKEGEISFIARHQSARKFIVQEIRNKGMSCKYSGEKFKNLDEWDFLNPQQFREASKYYVLHLIYFNVSDETDDRYAQKSDQYLEKYRAALDLAFLSLDLDGDGVAGDGDIQTCPTAIVRAV